MTFERTDLPVRHGRRAVALLVFGFVFAFAGTALAQRSVPVRVENDRSQPIPVEFVQSGAGDGTVQHVLCLQGIQGPGVGNDYPGCSEISAVGLEVHRSPRDDGEKGGTADINIGVGTLSPVEIRKPTDGLSGTLFSYAMNGNSFGTADIYVLEQREGWSKALPTLEIHLERTFVQGLDLDRNSLSETVDFYFNQIEVTSYSRSATGSIITSSSRCWDKTQDRTCSH